MDPYIERAISDLRKSAEKQIAEASEIEAKTKEFPDLKRYVGRWNKIAYYSRSVNEKAADYDVRHNCGCCDDSPLEIWPYVETSVGRIYSDPPSFMVGGRDPGRGGDTAYLGWEEKLRSAGISDTLIERISCHFSNQGDEDEAEDE